MRYYQPLLPYFEKEEVDEANKRYFDNLWKRWFGYYRKCKDESKKLSLINQYNRVCFFGKDRG